MTPSDELRELWQSDINEAMNQRDLLRDVERRIRNFDRANRRRGLVDILAMLVVIAVYLWLAVGEKTTFERVADLCLAACAIWVIFYVRRYAKLSRKPEPEQTLGAYRRALVQRYDRQIRLWKSAKYWFILPMWLAVLLYDVAYRVSGGKNIKFAMVLIVVTVGYAFAWWLYEGRGVRCLERKQRELATLIGVEGVAK
jgi:hypothetical protein